MFATPNVLSQMAESRLPRSIPRPRGPPAPVEEPAGADRTSAPGRPTTVRGASLA